MSKVPMIFEIKLMVEKPQNKISIREKSHGKAGNRSPISNFSIINCFRNDCASEHMSDGIHVFIITCYKTLRQW